MPIFSSAPWDTNQQTESSRQNRERIERLPINTDGPNSMFKPIVRTLLILPLVFTLCSAIGAQTGNVDAQSAVQLFLQSHPEVVDQLKALLAQQLQDEGSAIDQQAISDATLSARLESDGKFRAAALRLLVDRGSISEEQAKA